MLVHKIKDIMLNLKKIFRYLMCSLLLLMSHCITASSIKFAKCCPEFKKAFLETVQLLKQNELTNSIKFIQEHLKMGGSVIYLDTFSQAIDDCIKALNNNLNNQLKKILQIL